MSDILQALKFVQGSIAKKDLVPELTHFHIANGRVSGYNGVLGLSSPIPFSIECKPKADKLIKAIANCQDTVALTMTPGGKLTVKSGSFRVHVEASDSEFPLELPQGDKVAIDGTVFLEAIKRVAPFMGEDASRKWAQGILIKDKSLFATNNVVLVQYWLGMEFPHVVNLPAPAVKEILRIKEPPTHVQVTESSFTVHYENARWMRTQMYDVDWPNLEPILNLPGVPTAIPEGLFAALDVIAPFANGMNQVFINDGRIYTHKDDGEGASHEVVGMLHEGIFNIKYLSMLKDNATHCDFSTWPKPCMFYGSDNKMRGAIVGMKA